MTSSRRAAAFGFCFEQLVRGGLRGVWLRNTPPAAAFVWAANHHSWWDGFVANAVLRHHGHEPCLLMDADNLRRFGFLTDLGAIPVDQPRKALAALGSGRPLIIFPEAELRAPGPLGPITPGAQWLARKAQVPIAIAATRVVLRGHQKPEAYVDVSVSPDGDVAGELAARLQVLDGELADSDPREPLAGFATVLTGRLSWDERISRWTARTHG
ncbi:1-acyl-sn-glycerol-3-phosphate acyltransferase [Jatrophihabitans telluris]|uniref:1-acyl-sn-glycerol-3-phosphate acyltransferase n=1 Tax=Jatrophihabitans telluris TaxID=2038343 RepID=A0ABY4QUS8_9ACTN|nr:lysophospholipid acyltransferase family protein [Jatrophihabitans telluris]UQX86857.1 1-acyl-sn-glycerol-3-phosphate acyltransferase [Jatrophihabitans telluris]